MAFFYTFFGIILDRTEAERVAARYFSEQWKDLQHPNSSDNDFWADIGGSGEAVIPGTRYTLRTFEDGTFTLYSYVWNFLPGITEVKPPTDEERESFLDFLRREDIQYDHVGLFNIAV